MSILRTAAPDTVRALTRSLTEVGVDLPDEVATTLELLDRVETRRPPRVEITALTAAYLDDADDDTLHQVAIEHTTTSERLAAWTEARIQAAGRVRAAITSNGDTITAQLQKMAAKPIQALEDTAALDTTDTVTLVRTLRPKDAQLAANMDVHAAHLTNLYALRGKVTKGATYGDARWGADCSRWREPNKITNAAVLTSAAEDFLRGIRAGAGLWFPLPAEAEAAAQPIIREAQGNAKDEKARSWGTGSIVA